MALAFACGALAGWLGRRAYFVWRMRRNIDRAAARLSLRVGSIVQRAP